MFNLDVEDGGRARMSMGYGVVVEQKAAARVISNQSETSKQTALRRMRPWDWVGCFVKAEG